MSDLKTGKLPQALLAKLLARNKLHDKAVVVSSGIGEDAAVIDTGGDNYLVVTMDPVTFATRQIGWYCVNINANDIACMGATPRWLLATLLLPDTGISEQQVEEIFADLLQSSEALNVALIGGHTEVTRDLNRPIIIGQMMGEVPKDKLVHIKNTRPGDAVVLTKGVGIEGTAIIANAKENRLKSVLDLEQLAAAKDFLHTPGISVVADAEIARDYPGVHGMHDPTEGGVATACHEIAIAADCGIRITHSALRIFDETRIICELYGLDPLGLIASGALLITCERSKAPGLVEQYRAKNIAAEIIGEILPKKDGTRLQRREGDIDLPIFEQDEITRIQ